MVLSSEPEARAKPSDEKATEWYGSHMPSCARKSTPEELRKAAVKWQREPMHERPLTAEEEAEEEEVPAEVLSLLRQSRQLSHSLYRMGSSAGFPPGRRHPTLLPDDRTTMTVIRKTALTTTLHQL